jgi:hypothetical protein
MHIRHQRKEYLSSCNEEMQLEFLTEASVHEETADKVKK